MKPASTDKKGMAPISTAARPPRWPAQSNDVGGSKAWAGGLTSMMKAWVSETRRVEHGVHCQFPTLPHASGGCGGCVHAPLFLLVNGAYASRTKTPIGQIKSRDGPTCRAIRTSASGVPVHIPPA
jgi:hypothetical protein